MKYWRLLHPMWVLLAMPLCVTAEIESDTPGGIVETKNVFYDFAEVEVGGSRAAVFELLGLPEAPSDLLILGISIRDDRSGSFVITRITPSISYPHGVAPGERLNMEVTFRPSAEREHRAVVRIETNTPIESPCVYTDCSLRGLGVPPLPSPDELVENLLRVYEEAIDKGAVNGLGDTEGDAEVRLQAFSAMPETASALILGGDFDGACHQLTDALLRADGNQRPSDLIGGDESVMQELRGSIRGAIDGLGCCWTHSRL